MAFLDQTIFTLSGEAVRGAQVLWAAFFLILSLVVGLVASTYASRHLQWKGSPGAEVSRLVVLAVRWKPLAFGCLAAAAALGLHVVPLVWIFLGLAALMVLVLRNLYTQIWSGVALLWERAFALGDFITVGDFEGEVESLGLRTTRLRSEERLQLVVPNDYITDRTITNWNRTEGGLRVSLLLEVTPGADSGAVIATLRKAAERNSRVRKSPSPKAFLVGFGARGVRYKLIVWVSNYTERPWVINELCRAVDSEFQRERIAIAYAMPASAAAPARTERAPRTDRSERSERPERTERSERSERSDRGDRGARPEHKERSDRPERAERSERSDRPERAERSERSDRPPRNRGRSRSADDEPATSSEVSEDQREKDSDRKTRAAEPVVATPPETTAVAAVAAAETVPDPPADATTISDTDVPTPVTPAADTASDDDQTEISAGVDVPPSPPDHQDDAPATTGSYGRSKRRVARR